MTPSAFRRLIAVAVGLTVLSLAGCWDNVAWLPDSSGFVFSEGEGSRLVHYDLKTKARRVFVKDTGARTPWVAVSPDGKQVAVAKFTHTKDSTEVTLQVLIYGLDGKEVQKSKVFLLGSMEEPAQESSQKMTFLAWGATDKIIVTDGAGICGAYTGIYDIDTDSMKVVPVSALYPLNNPVRPDRKGFLAYVQSKKHEDAPAFIDWEGKVTRFPLGQGGSWEDNAVAVAWEGTKRRHTSHRGSFTFDTETGKIARDEDQKLPLLPDATDEPGWAHKFPNRTYLYAFAEIPNGKKEHVFHIELQRPEKKERKIVLEPDQLWVTSIFPSPDATRVAVVLPDGIRVIDADGGVVEVKKEK
jgi:hypothetical protein